MKWYLLSWLFFILGVILVPHSSAIITGKVDRIAIKKYTFGNIESISPTEIILKEYNAEKLDYVNTSYILNSQTELSNVISLDDLSQGDKVEIFYQDDNGGKIATNVSKGWLGQ